MCSFAVVANAQSAMTNQQVMDFIITQRKQGVSNSLIIKSLMMKGVKVEQIQRIRRNYQKQLQKEQLGGRNISGVDTQTAQRTRQNKPKDEKENKDFSQRKTFQNYSSREETDFEKKEKKLQDQEKLEESLDFILPDSTELHSYVPFSNKKEKQIFGHNIFNNKKLTFETDQNIATPNNYRLGAGDVVFIDVWGASQKQYSATVSPDGTIQLDGYGPMKVMGLTVAQANAALKTTLGTRYSGSNIRLTVGEMKTITVNVMGEVKVPGTYTLSAFATIFHALYQAGGPNEIGTLRNVKVYRNEKLLTNVDIYDYILNGRLKGNIRLATNDVIYVGPYDALVNIRGKVKRPMYYEMKPSESVATLVKYAGGFTGDAYEENIRLIRKKGGLLSVHTLNAFERRNFLMQDADSVYVDSTLNRYANMVEIRGAILRSGKYQMDGSISTIRQLIENAGGLAPEAVTSRGIIHRRKADRSLSVENFNIADLLNNRIADISLHNEDIIFIPSRKDLNEELTLTINGEVQTPGVYDYAENMSIEDFILQAGGLTDKASLVKVDVSRRIRNKNSQQATQEIAEHYTFSIKDGFVLEGTSGFRLEPFDEVYVRSSPGYVSQQHISIEGEVNFPGQHVITKKNSRLSDIVKSAGGVTPNAYTKGARLERTLTSAEKIKQEQLLQIATTSDSTNVQKLQNTDQKFVGINLDKALEHPGDDRYDLIVRDGDRLIIPQYTNTVSISGEVMYPNTINYLPGASLSYYINQCGGYSMKAKENRLFVVHMNGTTSRLKSAKDIQPGCTIVVPTKKKRSDLTTAQTITLVSTLVTLAAVVVSAFRK